MKDNLLTRAVAIKLTSLAAVEKVEHENCDYTNRCMQAHEDDEIEFSASVECQHADGRECTLTVYYYVDKTWADSLDEDTNMLDLVNWESALKGYLIN